MADNDLSLDENAINETEEHPRKKVVLRKSPFGVTKKRKLGRSRGKEERTKATESKTEVPKTEENSAFESAPIPAQAEQIAPLGAPFMAPVFTEPAKQPARVNQNNKANNSPKSKEDDVADIGSESVDNYEGVFETEGGSEDESTTATRRRRRRRRASDTEETTVDDPPNTITRVRAPRAKTEETNKNTTRIDAKRQRRRDGRDTTRRRSSILAEADYLAHRDHVARTMVVQQIGRRTQFAILEDGVLVEHYVADASVSSLVGNVYLGRVQNVLPSMEAAFVDIGRGRNAVLYAGEVNWDATGLEGKEKRIELALQIGDPIMVQVTKDPVGQKGARITSQISLPGRFVVYVPDGSMSGISRRLPEAERNRLKSILRNVMPPEAGVIVRTAAEGISAEALEQDAKRLAALWEDITAKAKSVTPPTLLSTEPDLAIKVARDMFNEDVKELIVSGDDTWKSVRDYVESVAPELSSRLRQWTEVKDVFDSYRIGEQITKALDRKVWLPSGGSLVIDRTEAMTVIDVNTGKYTGQGGNLEQTVTSNNLEAAEEIVRQLRLRDIGGIIVVDFIDMVLESNRDQVLRRLVECLGRDRTKHQVAEVTSLGLVQLTRKKIGSGLIESFSTLCDHCMGRGVIVSMHEQSVTPKLVSRKPAGVVDPAEVAARSFEQDHEAQLPELEHDHEAHISEEVAPFDLDGDR